MSSNMFGLMGLEARPARARAAHQPVSYLTGHGRGRLCVSRGRASMADPNRARGVPREKPQLIADELRSLIVTGQLVGGRLARPRAGSGRAVRCLAALAARGAAHPRGGGADLRRPRGARGRHRPRARRADDRPHRGAGAPGPQRAVGRRRRGPQHPRARGRQDRRARPRRRRSASKELLAADRPAGGLHRRSRGLRCRQRHASTSVWSPWPATRRCRSSPRC